MGKKRDMGFSKSLGSQTFSWSTDMSQQALYQVLSIHGYGVTQIVRDEKRLLLHCQPQPHDILRTAQSDTIDSGDCPT